MGFGKLGNWAGKVGTGLVAGSGLGATAGVLGAEYVHHGQRAEHKAMSAQRIQEQNQQKQLNDRLLRSQANINSAYGYLPAMSQFTDAQSAGALTNRANINNAIEQNVGLTRNSASATNIAGAEGAARQASFRAAGTGLTGSSVDTASKRRVLGGYLQGRAGVAQSAMGARMTGRNALEQQRLGLLGGLNQNTPTDYAGHAANLDLVGQLGQAQRQVYPQAIGQGIGELGNALSTGILYQNQGMQGLRSFGLPTLSGGTKKSSGGLAT